MNKLTLAASILPRGSIRFFGPSDWPYSSQWYTMLSSLLMAIQSLISSSNVVIWLALLYLAVEITAHSGLLTLNARSEVLVSRCDVNWKDTLVCVVFTFYLLQSAAENDSNNGLLTRQFIPASFPPWKWLQKLDKKPSAIFPMNGKHSKIHS